MNNYDAEEHDYVGNSKKVTVIGGTISAAGQVTVTPLQAWPDPKGYIGLVTITGSLSAAAGNITLDPGSKTQIVGNVTLSDSKGFIGLTTTTLGTSAAFIGIVTVANSQVNTGNVTLNPSPNFIGIVTVANPGATTGNVTLDAGSKTGIVGNVTLSDSKGFVGLVTVNIGSSNTVVLGNGVANVGFATVTTTNPGSFSGNVTLDPGSKTQVIGNVTLTDSKGYIGLVTVTQASSARTITGNVTLSDAKTNIGLVTLSGGTAWADPHTYIGLVTVTGSLSAAAGNITLDPGSKTGIVGNITLSDPKGFIGLVTAVGSFSANIANITLNPSSAYVGLVTATLSSMATVTLGTKLDSVNDSISVVQYYPTLQSLSSGALAPLSSDVLGRGLLGDPKSYVGLVTATIGNIPAVTQSGTWNVGLSAGTNSVGFASITPVAAWPDPHTYIGLVTITGALSAAAGNITLDPGSKTGLVGTVTIQDGGNSITVDGNVGVLGNVTLSDSKGFIGLVTIGNTPTVTLDNNRNVGIQGNVTISDSKGYIGLVTSTIGNSPVLGSGVNSIGFATVSNAVAWPDPKTYIGLVTITGALSAAAGNITLDAGSKTGLVGTVTIQDGGNSITVDGNVGVLGNVTLSDSKGFIGLVTAWTRNAGTTKTLIPLPIGLGNNSLLTVAVPTNAQKINATQLVLNSNITTEIALKSGVTYLTGNASIGVTLFPGGGFVMSGSPDSPSWIGCASGALVVEKRDPGGTVSKVGGNVIYFDE